MLSLTLVALIVLNTGLVWLVLGRVQAQARIGLAEQVAGALAVELTRVGNVENRESQYRAILGGFKNSELDIVELYVTDAALANLASVRGRPPKVLDTGLREALFAHRRSISVEGRYRPGARVVVSQPVPPDGRPLAVLRVTMPIDSLGLAGSGWGLMALYAGFTLIVVGLSGYVLFRQRLVLPIRLVQAGTERIASGDFDHRVTIDASRELVDLTEALNRMATSLAEYRHRTQDQLHNLEQANLALARAQQDLIRSARLASVGRLAAGIAHEVGNPLAAVVGYVDLLRETSSDPQLSRELLDRTARELERLHRILRDLLDYARPRQGEPIPIPVARLIDDAIQTVRYQPAFREVEILRELGGDSPLVRVEPDKLHQVLVNLLLNAADAMDGKGRVRIHVSQDSERVVVLVHDSGPGLSPQAIERLFEPFFTTKAPREGAGLGLATSQSLIEAMGGSIEGRNHAEKGAEFKVSLPRCPESISD